MAEVRLGGESSTPYSTVRLIAEVIEPLGSGAPRARSPRTGVLRRLAVVERGMRLVVEATA